MQQHLQTHNSNISNIQHNLKYIYSVYYLCALKCMYGSV